MIRTRKPRWCRGGGFSERRLGDCSRGFPQAGERVCPCPLHLRFPRSPPQSPRGACTRLLAVALACASLTRFTAPLSPALRNTDGRGGGCTHVPGARRTPRPASAHRPEWNVSMSTRGHQALSLGAGRTAGGAYTASLSRVVPRRLSLPGAAPAGGPSALRGEDRGEPPQLTPALPRSLTLTLGGLGKARLAGASQDAVSETTCSSWASATLFYPLLTPSLCTPWTCARQPCSHTPATTGG